jgi:hypothetical protein
MANTTKPLSRQDYENIQRYVYNETDASITTNGFLVGQVGRKIAVAIQTTAIPNDTEVISYFDGTHLLYTLTIIYTDGTRQVLVSAERTA